MDALTPQFKFRMLRLERGRGGIGVRPILVSDFIVVSEDVFDFVAVLPREHEAFLRPFEVILDVTLRTDVAAHLLPRGVFVHDVIRNALTRL